ncbi:MAG: TadE/TadG family type IV pilus assembly protein [Pseudomonadota bacterium]
MVLGGLVAWRFGEMFSVSWGIAKTFGGRIVRDDDGSASVEFVFSIIIIFMLVLAGSDLSRSMRGATALQTAAGDAARRLSLTPRGGDGALMDAGISLAHQGFLNHLAVSGLEALALVPPEGASCTTDRVMCHRIEEVAGSEAALGEPQRRITVWVAAASPSRFLRAFADDTTPARRGSFHLTADARQLHLR